MTTIAELLRGAPSEPARRDLEVLIAESLGVSRAHLYAHGEESLDTPADERLRRMMSRYRAGIPVAYIIGHREFWDLSLDVSPAVLIPRPETELLVELALKRLRPSARVLDLGTGSGAIALAIKRERTDCVVTGTDISEDAIEVARHNAVKHELDVATSLGDWYAMLSGKFDLIVSNPPYIRSGDPHLNTLVSEPQLALVGGDDGLDALRIVIGDAPQHLLSAGWLLVEHGFDQAAAVRLLFVDAGFEHVKTHCDVAGHERVTLGKR